MGAVGVSKKIGGGRGNHGDVDVYFSVLDCLPASAVGSQHTHAAHFALSTVIAEWTIHRAFDAMDDAGLHQLNRGFLRWKGCAGQPCEVFDSQFCRRLYRHESYLVTIT